MELTRWRAKVWAVDPDKDQGFSKLHGPRAAEQMYQELGPERAKRMGWAQGKRDEERGFWACSELQVGDSLLEALETLHRLFSGWSADARHGLVRIQLYEKERGGK